MSEWISVEDRLPEDNIRVLGTNGFKHEIVIHNHHEFKGFSSPISEYGGLYILTKVSHWMPLPTPPEENDRSSP